MNKELFKLRDLKTDDVKKYIDFLSDPEVAIWLEMKFKILNPTQI